MGTYIDIDPALLAEFLDESYDMLSGLDSLFVKMEAEPGNVGNVEAIFRPIHSIKGNSAFFGFLKVKTLAHEMETLLDLVRKGGLSVSRQLIDVLLEGVDELRQMIERGRANEPEVTDETVFADLVSRVQNTARNKPASSSDLYESLVDRLKALSDKFPEIRGDAESILSDLAAVCGRNKEAAPSQPATKGVNNSAEIIIAQLNDILSQPIEQYLSEDDAARVEEGFRALALLADNDSANKLLEELLDLHKTFTGTVGFDSLLAQLLREKLAEPSEAAWKGGDEVMASAAADTAKASSAPPPQASTAPAESPKAADTGETPEKSGHGDTHKTMRVAESHIDTFLAYVGELLVVGDMFGHLQNRLAGQELDRNLIMAFRRANETFAALSNSLQRSIMSIRKVSVRTLTQKVPRMVRDIASKSGKDIAVVCEGEEIEVDKSHIDMLDAPLTHMVRNAADHGIEPPELRRQAGKPSAGLLKVTVSETATAFILSVSDDGAGLNYDAIRAKAESMGLIKPGAALRQEDLVNFIFVSGVSTAKKVTDVSGRGVGMDVVKRMIDEAGGVISIQSERGKGSTFAVTLPKSVTTQIMQGFLVEACGQTYIFSMDKIHETARINTSEINHVADKGKCVVRHGNVLPLLSLREVLGLPSEEPSEQAIVVSVDLRRARFVLGVDKVLGVQQVVVRPMEGLSSGSDAIAGGALMGDGSVALIIDLEKLYSEYEGGSSQ